MAQRFETRLQECGCEMDLAAFRRLLAETLQEMFGGWNDEELMHNPREALRYCQRVRQRVDCDNLPDDLILRVLSGTRKNTAL